MAINIKDFRMAIRIDNSEAKVKFDETKRQLEQVTAEMQKLNDAGRKNSAEYKALKQRQDELNTSLYRQRLEAGRTALTYNELRQGASQLRRELNRTKPGTAEWKRLQADLQLTRQRMAELRGTATETGLSIGKVADGFNRYMGLAAGAVASITGLTLTMRQSVEEYAKMEEAESQVIKYTGMTREEVKQLNEAFKAMDTRTPREELNRLAGEAGKLGITGVEQVLEFVQAADMINVALGEDLGEEAVNQIGKLSQMFGDESRSLKENMLAIGSAVNQVAQSTSASEPYLVQFTARMGGVGKQARMSVTDIMGFASALDQNMLRSEMASTALSGLIMRVFQEPAKYAKLAQMDVEEFTRLVETDVNEAVMQFLEALNKMGGMTQMAPVLKEMKLSGAEAASVISTLAGNVELVRKEQENANQAFTEGTSIVNEFGVQNSTVQAELEKARKQFQDIRVELGERLQPVMKHMISFGSLTVKGLLAIINAVGEYRALIVSTTAAIGVYTAAVNASVIADKAKALWTGRIVTGLRTLTKVISHNPWGVAITAVSALVGWLVKWNKEQIRANDSLADMNRELASEQSTMNHLFGSLQKAGDGTERRRKLIEEINTRYGTYLPNLLSEKSTLDDIKTAYEQVNSAMVKHIAQKHREEEAGEVTDKAAEKQMSLLESLRQSVTDMTGDDQVAARFQQDLREMASAATRTGTDYRKAVASSIASLEDLYLGGKKMTGGMKSDVMDFMNTVYQLELALRDINKKYAGWIDTGTTATIGTGGTGGKKSRKVNDSPSANGGLAESGQESALKARQQQLEQQYRMEVNLLKQKYLDEQLTQEEYEQQLYTAESAHLEARKALLEEFGQDTSGLQGQIYDRMIAEANRRYEEDRKLAEENRRQAEQEAKEEEKRLANERKKQREEGLAAIDNEQNYDRQLSMLEAMYNADLLNYEEYQRMKDELAENHEQQRMETVQNALGLVSQAASAASQLVQTLQDRELAKVEARYDKQIKRAEKAGKDTTKLEEEKEAALEAVRKKYADKQFAANVLQIASDTAVAIMRSYAQMGILGPIYAAIVAAQGAIQIAVAKQQRDEAMGLKAGGFSDEYVQGYTRRGNPEETAGVIPVHKNEFVANHEAVANPAVRQFLDVFDLAQKRGTIRMLNTTQILEQVRTRQGRYSGGYSDENAGASRPSASPLAGMTAEQRSQVVVLLQENNRLLTILTEKELVVDPRKVRDGIKRVEQLEKNVSR